MTCQVFNISRGHIGAIALDAKRSLNSMLPGYELFLILTLLTNRRSRGRIERTRIARIYVNHLGAKFTLTFKRTGGKRTRGHACTTSGLIKCFRIR